jgi:membrane fusion protein, peptide pheromone/bacteriocin exporter
MAQLFPSDIIKGSSENYFSEQNSNSRVIYLSVILFLLAVIGLLPWISVQVSTQSEGVLRSGYEDNPVVPVVSGVVKNINISENQYVKKDDTLLVIASDRIDQEITLLTFRQKEDSLLLFDLNKLVSGKINGLMTSLCRQENTSYQVRFKEQEAQLLQAESDYLLAERLFTKGITPKYDFEKIGRQLQIERNRYASVQSQQLSQWQGKLKETTLNLAELSTRLGQLDKEKEQYCLKAPIAGTTIGYTGLQAGNFVVPNQQIATIAPENDLLVECYVSPSDIGLIEKGMAATFQFHAFNYNLWGVATGEVNEISNNVIKINNRPYFRVKCKLDQHFLKLKNGYTGRLKKGMTLTGRFKVADRTLYQLLFDKADNWLNPKRKSG